jgi:hypothetical protein
MPSGRFGPATTERHGRMMLGRRSPHINVEAAVGPHCAWQDSRLPSFKAPGSLAKWLSLVA